MGNGAKTSGTKAARIFFLLTERDRCRSELSGPERSASFVERSYKHLKTISPLATAGLGCSSRKGSHTRGST